jgi:hypothetical protein
MILVITQASLTHLCRSLQTGTSLERRFVMKMGIGHEGPTCLWESEDSENVEKFGFLENEGGGTYFQTTG